ncbi:hypothetical protein QYE76_067023 [Lolium multiflorum]|uniref:Retrotransposon gag domain-containing protein n=1 Tax=Lolium multiflorum TaxID=4521 RepID=A0AAD8WAJ5_LOLMU|nr:hypothetical protein QYE76_067023 [Lolium multiflorum]
MMTWEDFKLKFSKYHVPQGLIKKMRDEFRELKQGRMSVVEYRDRFLTLSRYAPDEIDTNEKRKERFLNGLHDEMQTVLVNIPYHFVFLLQPRRQQDLNSDELRRRDLRARSLQTSLRSKIATVDREIFPAADSWSRGPVFSKFDLATLDSDYHRHSDRQPKPITEFMKKSPAVGPPTPAPPSASHTAPPSSPPQADQSPPPAANTPPEIIPVSSEKVGGEDPKAKGPAQEETQDQGEAEVTSSEKVGAGAGDVVVFPKNFGDPTDLTSTPKAYATKFFKQLTEPEKWELEQDLLNAMLNNAWGKPDAGTSEIQDFKKGVGEFLDKLICKQKEQQALHYELHKNIALQPCYLGRIFLPGYDLLRTGKPALLLPRTGDKAEGGGAAEGACRASWRRKTPSLSGRKAN